MVSIAHAVWLAASPDSANEISWEGLNYNRQDSQGTRGTVTFALDGSGLVGVIRDDNSPRAPWRSRGPYELDRFIAGIPAELRALAQEETLQYVLDEWEGKQGPIITTAFWSEGNLLRAAEPWEGVVEHGAHLLRIELMDPDDALAEFADEYEWEDPQLDLVRDLFDRRMANPAAPLLMQARERKALLANGKAGLAESRELLGAVGIVLP